MKLIKEDERGKTFDAGDFKVLYKLKSTISGDNSKNVEEELYLVKGSAKLTLENKTWTEEAPAKIYFPAKTYHKIEALSDITLILFEK